DRVGPSRMVPPALLSYVAATVAAAVGTTDVSLATCGALAGIGHGYCFPVLTGQAISRTPPDLRGTALSLFTALWDLARLVLVPVAGALADATSDGWMLCTAAGLALVGLAGWAILEAGVSPAPSARS
ncbi:MAG: MFS transporter, partial [Myxococcota bacterium]